MNHEKIAKKETIYFELVTRLGSEMLENGGEIFRTGDVMTYAAHALGLKDFNTFVIANGIFASMLADGQTYSCRVRYISLSPINICRLEALNALSRKIVAGLDNPAEIEIELDRIQSLEASSTFMKIISSGFGSGGFCYLFGGSFYDALTQGLPAASVSVAGSPAHRAFTSAPAETAAVTQRSCHRRVTSTILSRLAAVSSPAVCFGFSPRRRATAF